ncbi:hypothetical protein JMUB7504_27450 [Staphylococcus aureus]
MNQLHAPKKTTRTKNTQGTRERKNEKMSNVTCHEKQKENKGDIEHTR